MKLPYFEPIDTVPTTILGFVQGTMRVENMLGVATSWLRTSNWVFWHKPEYGYAVTHLQKYSKFGFLLTWPFCFHIYWEFKKQTGNDIDGWVPGSEKVFYARTPGYRMDIDYGMKWTWGYIGLHWD